MYLSLEDETALLNALYALDPFLDPDFWWPS